MTKALTVKAVDALKSDASRKEVPDGGLPGLYLVVQPSGAKSWAVRYRFAAKPRKLTIGSYPAFGLADARRVASAALRSVSEGRDPAAEKLATESARADASNLVSSVLDNFVERYVNVKNRESTARETKRFIDNEVRPKWGKRQIQTITRRDVIVLLDGMVDRGAPSSANRVHAILRRFFNWTVERDIIPDTPVANVKAPGQEISRDRVLTAEEIKLLWQAAQNMGWPFGPMVQLLLLTGQRREEVSGASWNEFALTGANPVWTIPKERAKNGKAHAVPLSPLAVKILSELPKVDSKAKLVLTTTGETPVSGFSRAKDNLDSEMLKIAQKAATERGENSEDVSLMPWRLHDLRRTAASGMASIGQPVHVVEAVLNHKSGSIKGVAAVYNRYDYAEEKKRALCAWAMQLDLLIFRDRNTPNVVAMKA